jgi:hypothetical protein
MKLEIVNILIERAEQSNSDYLKGYYKTQEELERLSENW